MSLTHLSSDRDSLVGKGAGEAVTPWRSVLGVSLLLCSAGAGSGGALTGSHPDMSDSRWISASLSPTPTLYPWLAFRLKTVFMFRHQLTEGIRSSWSGAFTKFSHTVPCIEALNWNKSMTRCIIYRCAANVVGSAPISPYLCTVGPAGYNIRQQAQRSTNALKTKNQDTNGETYANNKLSHAP